MPTPPAEHDLFQQSTMTFGQHLEELRACLFKSIYGLAIGCIVGLVVGGAVVRFVKSPVESALKKFYQQQAETKVTLPQQLELLREAGYTDEADVERMRRIVADQHVSMEVVSIDPKALSGQLNSQGDAPPKPAASAPETNEGLRKIVLFRPITDDPRISMKSFSSQETFMIYMKASLLVGVVLSSPWIFYQIWSFVAAGLYPHERRYVHLFLPLSIVLFLAGAATAFFFAFEQVLSFLLSFNRMLDIDPDLRISEWMSFVLLLPLAFGISFQLPLVMLFMERIGIFTVQAYLKSWRMAILAIFVMTMILSPSGDPYSMLLMAVPLTLLYFGGAALCRFLPKAKSRFE